MTTIAMKNLWTYIESLGLTHKNRQWLADRLIEPKTDKNIAATDVHEPCCYTLDEVKARVLASEPDAITGSGMTNDAVTSESLSWI